MAFTYINPLDDPRKRRRGLARPCSMFTSLCCLSGLQQLRNQTGPPGLMRRPDAAAGVAVEASRAMR